MLANLKVAGTVRVESIALGGIYLRFAPSDFDRTEPASCRLPYSRRS
jgi:hypothetical protein